MKKRLFGTLLALVLAITLVPMQAEAADVEDTHTHVFGDWEVTAPATCTEDGEQKRACACGEEEREAIPAGHTLVRDPVVSPSCTEDGLTSGEHCSVCGEVTVEQQVITAAGHMYILWYESVPQTCTQDGEERRDCIACDHYETRVTEATGHVFGIWTVTASTSCTQDGEVRRDCIRCEEYETQTFDAWGHVFGPWYTRDGVERRDCIVCDHYETRTDEGHVHAFGEWEVITAATCTASGEQKRVCACGETETGILPAAGHTLVNDPAAAPTCTEDGLTAGQHCEVCGEITVEQQVITATGHIFGLWTQTTAPTCTGEGEERRECVACDHYETRAAEAQGHLLDIPEFTWSEDYTSCTAQAECLRCGEMQDLNGSVTSETTPATSTEDGKTVYTVTLEWNGEVYTDTVTVPIPATGVWSVMGDVNHDLRVNFKDAILILQYASERITDADLDLEVGDVNGDGRYNFKDAILMLQFASERIESFPV